MGNPGSEKPSFALQVMPKAPSQAIQHHGGERPSRWSQGQKNSWGLSNEPFGCLFWLQRAEDVVKMIVNFAEATIEDDDRTLCLVEI